MAAAAHPAAPVTPSLSSISSRRPLPHGACNFRDLTAGSKAPSCGCRRFWCDGTHTRRASTNNGTREADDHTPWCVCGHHACYHESNERQAGANAKGNEYAPAPVAPTHAVLHTQEPIYVQLVSAKSGEHARFAVTSGQVALGGRSKEVAVGFNGTPSGSGGQGIWQDNGPDATAGSRQDTIEANRNPAEKLLSRVEPLNARRTTSPVYSTPELPPVPSVCLLNSHDLRPISPGPQREDKQPRTGYQTSAGSGFLRNVSGLGLLLQAGYTGDNNVQLSLSPTVADEHTGDMMRILDKPTVCSARHSSADRRTSPSRALLQHVLEGRSMGPPLNVAFTPNAAALEDVLQSATEVATPSVRDTPDLRGLDQTLQDTKALVDLLSQNSAAAELDCGHDPDAGSPGETHSPQAAGNRLSPTASSNKHQESCHAALKLVPSTLQQLSTHIRWIYNHLAMEPNVSTSIFNLGNRIEALENASFNHVPPDELHHQFDLIDGRLLDVETRMDDHDKLHASIDADHSSRDVSTSKRRTLALNDGTSFVSNASFRSNGSLNSATSSALIAAAIDRVETEARMKDIEQRLDGLEATAPPSFAQPWEIEVVLLPWGRDLKGIWFSPDEPIPANSRATTQHSEEWTQAHTPRSSDKSTTATLRTGRDGWSTQAIHDWANTADEWLSPKACGVNGVVFKRLQSRGLVRQVTLRNPSARDIWTAIAIAFECLVGVMCGTHEDSGNTPTLDSDNAPFFGLAASLIPLRKVHKSSRLLFLSPSEMVTPAVWTADFLASNVMMRAAGGQKRLFITQREAYLQRHEPIHHGWTWQKLRELPRVHPSQNSTGNPNFVAEADAKEACWAHHPALDPPASANSSFSSDSSTHSSHRNQDRTPAPPSRRLSIRAESHPQSSQQPPRPIPPISPLSELHPDPRPQHNHRCNRTLSIPLTDSEAAAQLSAIQQPQPKRRVTSCETGPSMSHAKSHAKRRRTQSPDFAEGSSSVVRANWGLTPRRSKEPPSPFPVPSSQRSGGVSNASAAGEGFVGFVGGGAYATPYSGMAIGRLHAGVEWRGGDTEVDEGSVRDEHGDDEVWEGVGDEVDEMGRSGGESGSEGDAVVGAEGFDDDEDDELDEDEEEGSDGSYLEDEMDESDD